MSYISLAFFALVITNLLDFNESTMVFSTVAFGLCAFISMRGEKSQEKVGCVKVFGIVFAIYIISTFIVSRSFINNRLFYGYDPANDLILFNVTDWSWSEYWFQLGWSYLDFGDTNGLYYENMKGLGYIANAYLGGSSVFSLSIPFTLFGVLTSIMIYKIFIIFFKPNIAANYTVLFSILSCTHLYSCLVIRDIMITFFFLWGFLILLRPIKLSSIFPLLLCFIILIGLRLYSGLYFVVFIMIWAYNLITKSKFARYKLLFVPGAIIAVALVSSSMLSSTLLDQTTKEIYDYQDYSSGRGNLSVALQRLPPVISQVALLFLGHTNVDLFQFWTTASNFSNFYIGLLYILFSIFTFVIFFGSFYYLFAKNQFNSLSGYFKVLLLVVLSYMAVSTAQFDIRRVMWVHPFLFLLFILSSNKFSSRMQTKVNISLIFTFLVLVIIYSIVRS
jgi:hypothetical protein